MYRSISRSISMGGIGVLTYRKTTGKSVGVQTPALGERVDRRKPTQQRQIGQFPGQGDLDVMARDDLVVGRRLGAVARTLSRPVGVDKMDGRPAAVDRRARVISAGA